MPLLQNNNYPSLNKQQITFCLLPKAGVSDFAYDMMDLYDAALHPCHLLRLLTFS